MSIFPGYLVTDFSQHYVTIQCVPNGIDIYLENGSRIYEILKNQTIYIELEGGILHLWNRDNNPQHNKISIRSPYAEQIAQYIRTADPEESNHKFCVLETKVKVLSCRYLTGLAVLLIMYDGVELLQGGVSCLAIPYDNIVGHAFTREQTINIAYNSDTECNNIEIELFEGLFVCLIKYILEHRCNASSEHPYNDFTALLPTRAQENRTNGTMPSAKAFLEEVCHEIAENERHMDAEKQENATARESSSSATVHSTKEEEEKIQLDELEKTDSQMMQNNKSAEKQRLRDCLRKSYATFSRLAAEHWSVNEECVAGCSHSTRELECLDLSCFTKRSIVLKTVCGGVLLADVSGKTIATCEKVNVYRNLRSLWFTHKYMSKLTPFGCENELATLVDPNNDEGPELREIDIDYGCYIPTQVYNQANEAYQAILAEIEINDQRIAQKNLILEVFWDCEDSGSGVLLQFTPADGEELLEAFKENLQHCHLKMTLADQAQSSKVVERCITTGV